MSTPEIDADVTARYRDAMARFPTGVTIVTTVDEAGVARGFTANSFCSLSFDPLLVLVCLAKSADCHPVFSRARHLAVHVVHVEQASLAHRFASRGVDKFAGLEPVSGLGGVPTLPDAAVVLECELVERHDGGDHTILVAEVASVEVGEQHPAVYVHRTFHVSPEAP